MPCGAVKGPSLNYMLASFTVSALPCQFSQMAQRQSVGSCAQTSYGVHNVQHGNHRGVHMQVMVFFSSCNSVKYHAELLNYIDIPVTDIHGKQKQQRRTTAYFEFCQADKGILLCTDVAARGLDIPAVDWIIQYDPPDDPKEYIHRVGRTARGKSGKGRALLLLLPEELGFLAYLKVS